MTRKDKFLRKCIACGNFLPKESLVRVTKDFSSGQYVLRDGETVFGRSFYVCKLGTCIDSAIKRVKKMKLNVSPDFNEKISAVLEK